MKKGVESMNGFLDQGVVVKGEIRFDDMLRVDGNVEGKITSENHLVVGASAAIEGEVEVGHATLGGTVRGVVRAKERIEILKGAKVFAELHTPILVIEEGAFFEGRCDMSGGKSAAGQARQGGNASAESPALKPSPFAAAKG